MAKEWKYDVRFCKCGRIHMIPVDKIDEAVKVDKNLLHICGGCGTATIIGADKEPDWDDPSKTIYNMYSHSLPIKEDGIKSISVSDFSESENYKAYSEILYSQGLRVPMMTGEYANSFSFGTFYDMWYPDWYKIERRGITVPEIMKFIENYKRDQRTVNMDRFIHETPDEYLEAISGYVVHGLDWKGTKWERE